MRFQSSQVDEAAGELQVPGTRSSRRGTSVGRWRRVDPGGMVGRRTPGARHGSRLWREAARLAVRAMALQGNLHPYSSRLRRDQPLRVLPCHDLNGFQYHPNWLHNLLIASSMGGLRL